MDMFEKLPTEEPNVENVVEQAVPDSPTSQEDTRIKVSVKRSKQQTADYYQKRKQQKILCDICGVHYTFSNGSHHKNTGKHQKNLMIKQLKDKLQTHEAK